MYQHQISFIKSTNEYILIAYLFGITVDDTIFFYKPKSLI
jgi:hypothetical protein